MAPTTNLLSTMIPTLPLDQTVSNFDRRRVLPSTGCTCESYPSFGSSAALPPLYSTLTRNGDGYPANLANTAAAPATIFVRGNLTKRNDRAVAIVGSRKAGTRALKAARSLGSRLAENGCTVVSGLARGVDTEAHLGALSAAGQTVAVIGTGVNRSFPPENHTLQERIAHAGAVVSQFDPDQEPSKTTFPARNAVIAGLARASLIVDAAERSGTRIQIDWTLRLGRPVLFWEPTIGHRDWARELTAENDLVFMVQSIEEVLSFVA